MGAAAAENNTLRNLQLQNYYELINCNSYTEHSHALMQVTCTCQHANCYRRNDAIA